MDIEGPSTNERKPSRGKFFSLQSSSMDGSGKRPWLESSKKSGNGDSARFGDAFQTAKPPPVTLLICSDGCLNCAALRK